MSLMSRLKKGIQERRAKGQMEKKERETIDREARAEARKEYFQAYREVRV
jgi:hypothetical protein